MENSTLITHAIVVVLTSIFLLFVIPVIVRHYSNPFRVPASLSANFTHLIKDIGICKINRVNFSFSSDHFLVLTMLASKFVYLLKAGLASDRATVSGEQKSIERCAQHPSINQILFNQISVNAEMNQADYCVSNFLFERFLLANKCLADGQIIAKGWVSRLPVFNNVNHGFLLTENLQ